MRRTTMRSVLVAVMALVGVSALASMASATKPDPGHKVTICHATASATNPYVVITVDIASIVRHGGHGRSGVNAGDIIPPFDIDGYAYAGHNWDAPHQAVYANDCKPVDATTTSTTTTSTTTTTQPINS